MHCIIALHRNLILAICAFFQNAARLTHCKCRGEGRGYKDPHLIFLEMSRLQIQKSYTYTFNMQHQVVQMMIPFENLCLVLCISQANSKRSC